MLITEPTLRKHYFSELSRRAVERDRVEARLGFKLWEQVEAGNVGAMREMRKLLDRDYEMQYGQQPGAPRPEADADEPAEKLGKKEAAVRDAHRPDVGTPLGELMARRQAGQRRLDA